MKAIKKVAVTPVQVNNGTIIDSFNTVDDKHTNAPSLNAVENELNNYILNTQDNQTTLTFSKYGTATIVRRGNVVSIQARMTMPADGSASSNYATLPNWAIPSTALLMEGNNINGTVGTDMNLYSASRIKILSNNGEWTISFVGNNTNTLNDVTCYAVMSYIVD